MTYQKLLKKLRGDMTQDVLAKAAGLHRNTVIKAESDEPVKFVTLASLLRTLGYADESHQMREMALLWLKAVSGINFSSDDAEIAFQEMLDGEELKLQPLLDRLNRVIVSNALTPEQIALLTWAASSPPVLEILSHTRSLQQYAALANELSEEPKVNAFVAEDARPSPAK